MELVVLGVEVAEGQPVEIDEGGDVVAVHPLALAQPEPRAVPHGSPLIQPHEELGDGLIHLADGDPVGDGDAALRHEGGVHAAPAHRHPERVAQAGGQVGRDAVKRAGPHAEADHVDPAFAE
ncbi:MAG: hypothetical protein ACK559_15875, partial [bacterium]